MNIEDYKFFDRGVLRIALDIHMTVTGSYERPDTEQHEDVEYLQKRLDEWGPSITNAKDFDVMVKRLIEVALQEDATRRNRK